ncbi:hypothetical protein OD350_24770 [Clostridium beijerinckii]|uniref:Uncharacterized protein n=1 Tax=Clostridium beijerinckii TaxID=1520 RepID=A0AAX0B4A9_CLOBE|nr:hypothetical protein [Clostridium beijerinckii]NRT90210.1 hypothetical protein [Clostridium beijerinckii]NYC69740.1 hypothetical protein [Clostridium beijerinckii]UYZ35385.1 hypothetical protein OD350_24770 [Clostridium beijerinckii]
MKLDKVKEFENIKKELNEYKKIYNDLITKRNNEYYEYAKEDFKNFFTEKGFKINVYQEEPEVVYGDTKIKMSKVISEDNYLNLHLLFNIKNLINEYNNEYEVLLGRLNNPFPIKMQDNNKYIKSAIVITEDILDVEIKNETRKLEEAKQESKSFNDIEWGYSFKLTNERISDQKCEYKTFREVLENIFK